MRLSDAVVCFRASGDNFLRSITRATVERNDGKRKIDFVEVILRLSEALVCFRASGDNFLRSITRAIVKKVLGNVKLIFRSYFETSRSSRLFSRLRG